MQGTLQSNVRIMAKAFEQAELSCGRGVILQETQALRLDVLMCLTAHFLDSNHWHLPCQSLVSVC